MNGYVYADNNTDDTDAGGCKDYQLVANNAICLLEYWAKHCTVSNEEPPAFLEELRIGMFIVFLRFDLINVI